MSTFDKAGIVLLRIIIIVVLLLVFPFSWFVWKWYEPVFKDIFNRPL